MKTLRFLTICALASAAFVFNTPAQKLFTTIGTPVTESFDSLARTGTSNPFADNSTIVGVYSSRTEYHAGTGSDNVGTIWSFGLAGSTERALGSIASGGQPLLRYGVRFRNNTGVTVTSIDVQFVGEQWRNAGNTATHVLAFSYAQAITFSDLASGTYIGVNQLDFSSLVNTNSIAALNGNLATNRNLRVATVNVTIPPGQEIMLRWTDVDNTGADHGFGVDDLMVTPRGPRTLGVDTLSDDGGLSACGATAGDCSLRGAVAAAADGDTIVFDNALGAGSSIVLGSEILIEDDILIDGPGAAVLSVDGGPGTNRIFRIDGASVAISGLTLAGGGGTGGGVAGSGGAIQLQSGSLGLSDVNISTNSASTSGGGIGVGAGGTLLTLTNVVFSGNSAPAGGAIHANNAANTINILDSQFQTNSSTTNGGAIVSAGTTTIVESAFTSNSVTNPGSSCFGGAISVSAGSLSVTDSTFDQNTATGALCFGGAIHAQGPILNLTDVAFTQNSSPSGGGGALNFTNFSASITGTIRSSTFDGNIASSGGGIAFTPGGAGSVLTIDSSAIVNNDTIGPPTGTGGGISHTPITPGVGEVTITNSTISANSADVGGAISNGNGAVTNLNFVSIVDNAATIRAPVFAGNGHFLKNSIVSNNDGPIGSPGDDSFTSQDYNHFYFPSPSMDGGSIGYESLGIFQPNDVIGPDPLLAPLALNGGTTVNHRPSNLSPVANSIPNGVNDCGILVNIDQRNNLRPTSAACEKGSVELLGPTAGAVLVSGIVRTAGGLPIRNAWVTLSGGGLAEPMVIATGSLGTFSFAGLRAGEMYVLYVSAGRHVFAEPGRTVIPVDDVDDLEFVAN